MNTYNSVFSGACVLCEQVARQVFDLADEQGPIMVIMDRDGHVWPSDSDAFARLEIGEDLLKGLCEKIDDGAEPVTVQLRQCTIAAGQLATDSTNCGYVMIILPGRGSESSPDNNDLVEIVLNLVSVVARLIEKNGRLYEHQVNQYRAFPQTTVASN